MFRHHRSRPAASFYFHDIGACKPEKVSCKRTRPQRRKINDTEHKRRADATAGGPVTSSTQALPPRVGVADERLGEQPMSRARRQWPFH